jgi:hypothetical protein
MAGRKSLPLPESRLGHKITIEVRMPDRGCRKAIAIEEPNMNKPPETFPVPTDKPAEHNPTFPAEGLSPVKGPVVMGKAESRDDGPRLVFRDGEAYVEGCDLPIWRMEMARRAGCNPALQLKLFPTLTPEGLDLAFAYAQEHSAEFDPLIRYHSGADIPPEDEGDDEDDAAFEAELDAMFTEYDQVFRRLAE